MFFKQVLSLPSNFIYNPPGSKRPVERQTSIHSQVRRQTLHSHQPITLSHLDDIKNIDESISDIYNIREMSHYKSNDIPDRNRSFLHIQTNLDDIISVSQHEKMLKLPHIEEKYSIKNINESSDTNLLLGVPTEQKPMHRLYGSTKHLFTKQKSIDISEETPFLLPATTYLAPESKSKEEVDTEESPEEIQELKIPKLPKHDSQESVQRIITERRKLDENLKDINQYDIFDITHGSEENLVKTDSDEKQESEICEDTQNVTSDDC